MPENTLLSIFYLLGSIFFLMAIVGTIGLAIGTWLAYKNVVKLRNTALTKLAAKQRSLTSLSTLAPVVISGVMQAFFNRRKK